MDNKKELQLMQGMYDRIYDMMTSAPSGKDAGFNPDTTVFQMVPCGLPVNPADYANQFSPINPNGNLNTAEFFSKLIDPVPRPQSVYARGSESIESTYGNVINYANASQKPDPDAQELYNKAKNFLTIETEITDFAGNKTKQIQNSAIYNEYINNRTAYISALCAYRNAYNNYDLTDLSQQRQWQANEPMLMNAINVTYNKWRSNGAQQVEEALNVMETSINNAISGILTEEKEQFKISQLASSTGAGAPWHLSYAMPANWYDSSAQIFTNAQIHSDRLSLSENSKFSAYGGETSFRYGIWSANASAEHSSEETNSHMHGEKLDISLDIAVVSLVRPWFNSTIFKMSGWSSTAYKPGQISSGKFDDVNAAMPLVPTGFVVAKNISISADFKDTDDHFAKQATSGSASIGIGPFRLSGHYSSGSSEHTFNSTYENGKISVPGMQIIGFISEVLPYSPKD